MRIGGDEVDEEEDESIEYDDIEELALGGGDGEEDEEGDIGIEGEYGGDEGVIGGE